VKVRLIEPAPPGMHVYSKVHLPRLGLPAIGAALVAQGHDVCIYVADLDPIDWNDVYTADIVGFSTTTSTVTQAYDFADDLRGRGMPTIIGGPHVTFMADEGLQHADYIARGEGGEQLMLELIEALQGQRSLDSIQGLSYHQDGTVHHNPLRAPTADLDSLPFPDLSLIKGNERMRQTPIMTSWGCPFDCKFCSVTAMFGKKYRFRSPENVLAELKQKQPKRVFFYDDNFAANRKRLKTLLQMIIDEGLQFSWSAQVRTDVARDTELLDLMHRSGCWMVYLGLESINQDTLDGYDKSQSVEDITHAVHTLHEHGIKSHGMFVLGADSDDKSVVRSTVDFALKHKIDTVMLNILTPLPGTPLFDEMDEQGRIFDKRWYLYDALHVVYTPENMTPYELQREAIAGYMRFYSLRVWLKYLFTFRFAKLMLQTWGYSIVRAWRKDKRNKDYLRALKRLRLPKAPKLVKPRSVDSDGGVC
jgi:anaerobic magnesium-protoporphyrin IX monomethyl ester cyclase